MIVITNLRMSIRKQTEIHNKVNVIKKKTKGTDIEVKDADKKKRGNS